MLEFVWYDLGNAFETIRGLKRCVLEVPKLLPIMDRIIVTHKELTEFAVKNGLKDKDKKRKPTQ